MEAADAVARRAARPEHLRTPAYEGLLSTLRDLGHDHCVLCYALRRRFEQQERELREDAGLLLMKQVLEQ